MVANKTLSCCWCAWSNGWNLFERTRWLKDGPRLEI